MHVQLNDVSFEYRNLFRKIPIIKNLSWELSPGVTGLLGPNGSGKTTLMRLIDRSLRESQGSILADGEEVRTGSRLRAYRRRLGIMPQDPTFVPWMTVTDTLEYLAWVHHIEKAARDKEVAQALEKVDLVPHGKKPVRALSGGQKRRLAFACATLGNPDLLLLDEPTAGLDPSARIAMRNLIRDEGKHATVLLSTHLIEDISRISTGVGILKEGQIAFSGPLTELERSLDFAEGHVESAFEQAYEQIIDNAGRSGAHE
ncbi:ABC transporter ATP-binding protein [Corynebacterium sp. HMSC28B08]|uniref:ABC transporter ATP-binding protein n=2 Tax=Corynebacterium TaxID=1716 RepID=UPI0008A30751|nr:ATP-binding cassette domain-containing protein [Corynebacterium sp. HMSC28B08]